MVPATGEVIVTIPPAAKHTSLGSTWVVTLSVTGRDIIEDGEFALTFHKDTAKWEWLGEAKQVAADNREAQIIRLLQQQSDPMGPTDIASELEISLQTVKNSLNRLRKRGSAHCPARGLWAAGPGT